MKPEHILAMAKALLKENNLEDWNAEFDSSKRAYGRCHFGKKKVTFSKHLIEHPAKEIVDTIRHEVSHAKAGVEFGDTGHGEDWKRIFLGMGGSGEIYAKEALTKSFLWHGTCNCIGNVIKRHRRRKNSFCTICFTVITWTNMRTKETEEYTSMPKGVSYDGSTAFAPVGMVWSATGSPRIDRNDNRLFKQDISLGLEKDV